VMPPPTMATFGRDGDEAVVAAIFVFVLSLNACHNHVRCEVMSVVWW
jgi:hypothetical protein